MNSLLWMLTSADTSSLTNDFSNLFYNQVWPYVKVVLWVLAAVLAVVLVVKGVTTALAVMKAADEPQVRQEKLGSFKYLAIGLGIAIVVLALAPFIVELILNNASVKNVTQKATTFLF